MRSKEKIVSLKNKLKAMKANIYGIQCPNCSLDGKPTAYLHLMRDAFHKKDVFYIKCRNCESVTPAGSLDFVFENWNDKFINEELKTLGVFYTRRP